MGQDSNKLHKEKVWRISNESIKDEIPKLSTILEEITATVNESPFRTLIESDGISTLTFRNNDNVIGFEQLKARVSLVQKDNWIGVLLMVDSEPPTNPIRESTGEVIFNVVLSILFPPYFCFYMWQQNQSQKTYSELLNFDPIDASGFPEILSETCSRLGLWEIK